MTTPTQQEGSALREDSAMMHFAENMLVRKRNCAVCEGNGYKSNGKDCGGCGATGEVFTYGEQERKLAKAYLELRASPLAGKWHDTPLGLMTGGGEDDAPKPSPPGGREDALLPQDVVLRALIDRTSARAANAQGRLDRSERSFASERVEAQAILDAVKPLAEDVCRTLRTLLTPPPPASPYLAAAQYEQVLDEEGEPTGYHRDLTTGEVVTLHDEYDEADQEGDEDGDVLDAALNLNQVGASPDRDALVKARAVINRYLAVIRELTKLRGAPDRTYMNMDLIKDEGVLEAWQELDATGKAAREALTSLDAALAGDGAGSEPIDMILFCPACGKQHIDAPDERTPDWTNPPHRSHLCHGCGFTWRPADVPTNGVERIKTRGKNDTMLRVRESTPSSLDGEKGADAK